MQNYSRKTAYLLRKYMTEAYERELRRELTKLDNSFTEWRNGAITSSELSHRIHKYETGPSRKLYKQYNRSPHDMTVAYAVVVGILDQEEIPAELLEAIERPLSFFQSMKEHDELREPG